MPVYVLKSDQVSWNDAQAEPRCDEVFFILVKHSQIPNFFKKQVLFCCAEYFIDSWKE